MKTIQDEAGAANVEISVGYIGLIPSSYPINAIYQWTAGPEEFLLRVALKRERTRAVEDLKERLRVKLAAKLPDVRFSFEPADIVSEVMSFGSPTPIEVAVNGPNLVENREYAEKLRPSWRACRRCATCNSFSRSTIRPSASRSTARRPGLSGVTVADVARSVVAATSSSRFVVPNYWPDPKSGIGYQVQIEVPFEKMNSIDQVETIPIQRSGGDPLLLRDVAMVAPGTMPGEFDRYNMKRVVSLTANIAGRRPGPCGCDVAAGDRPRRRAAPGRDGRDPRPDGRRSTRSSAASRSAWAWRSWSSCCS